MKVSRISLLVCGIGYLSHLVPAFVQTTPASGDTGTHSVVQRDGQNDFDFQLGVWTPHWPCPLNPYPITEIVS